MILLWHLVMILLILLLLTGQAHIMNRKWRIRFKIPNPFSCKKSSRRPSKISRLPETETNIALEIGPSQKGTSSSNHPCSSAMLVSLEAVDSSLESSSPPGSGLTAFSSSSALSPSSHVFPLQFRPSAAPQKLKAIGSFTFAITHFFFGNIRDDFTVCPNVRAYQKYNSNQTSFW